MGKSFVSLTLTFKSLVSFELISVYQMKQVSNFILLIWLTIMMPLFVEKIIASHLSRCSILLKSQLFADTWIGISELPTQFYLSIHLTLCSDHTKI